MQSEPHDVQQSSSPAGASRIDSTLPGIAHRPMMMVEMDAHGSVLAVNDLFASRMGWSTQAMLNLNYADLCTADGCGRQAFAAIADRLAAGQSYSDTVRCVGKSGETVWMDATFCPITDANGAIVRIVQVALDITSEQRQHEDLHVLLMGVNATGNAVIISAGDNRIVHVNEGYTRMFGVTEERALGKSVRSLLAAGRTDRAMTEYLDRRTGQREGYHDELLVFDRAGKPLWVAAVANPVFDAAGNLTHVVDVLTDITHTKIYEVLQRKVLQAMMSEAPVHDIMEIICREVESMAPDVTTAMLAVDPDGRLHPLAAPSLPDEYIAALEGLQANPQTGSPGTVAYGGESVLVADTESDVLWANYNAWASPLGLKACWASPIKVSDGRVIGILAYYFREKREADGVHRRLAERCIYLCSLALDRDQARARIRQLAFYDELTGLPNRGFLQVKAEQAIGEMALRQASLAILFLNVDRFKHVNDTLGHAAGDALLREIANRLRNVVRSGDMVGRLSGDEFAVVLPQCDASGALTVSKNLLTELTRPFNVGITTLLPSVSIGVSIYPDNGREIDALLRHADMAMNSAKSGGSRRACFFSAEMNVMVQERHTLEAAFRDALQGCDLQLHYQPQLELATGTLYGVEALARWNHPTLGRISPTRFVPLAEELGLIGQLGSWAVGTACRQLAAWRERGLLVPRISVNLSPTNFHHATLCEEISDALVKHNLKASELTLEMTESVLMDTNPVTLRTIAKLHELGVRLSLDDFGIGYSSLGHLRRLPANELKLDRAFVLGVENDRAARALTSAIIRIGESLNLAVVAEGIENEEQRRFLTEEGCDAGQGFFYTEALDAPRFERWVKAYRPAKPPA